MNGVMVDLRQAKSISSTIICGSMPFRPSSGSNVAGGAIRIQCAHGDIVDRTTLMLVPTRIQVSIHGSSASPFTSTYDRAKTTFFKKEYKRV